MSRDQYGSGTLYQRGETWWVQIMVDGQKTRISTKTKKKSEAQRFLQSMQGQKHRGEIIPTKKRVSITCGKAMDDYVERRRKTPTYDTYFGQIENHLKPYFGEIPVNDLTTDTLETYRTKRSKERSKSNSHSALPTTQLKQMGFVTPSTINRELATLRAALRELQKFSPKDVRGLPHFPMTSEKDCVRFGYISEQDMLEKLLPAMPDYLRAFVVCKFYVGARTSEWLRLDWNEIDFETGIIHFIKTKTHYPREVPIYEGLMREVLVTQKRRRDEFWPELDAVFTYDGKQRLTVLKKAWMKAVEKAGLPKLRPHDLRRSANRWMRKIGMPQAMRMRILGHKTTICDVRYGVVDLTDIHMARAMASGKASS